MSPAKESNMRQRHLLALCLTLSALTPTFLFALSDDERAAEEAVYSREEQEEEKLKMDPNFKSEFEGVVSLDPALISAKPESNPAEATEQEVGKFTLNGKEFILKIEIPELIGDLKAVNGKAARLSGKIRVNGKYFIARSVVVPSPGPPRVTRGKRGGA